MDDSANSKRLILATGLCLVVMVVGQILMPPPKRPPPSEASQATQPGERAGSAGESTPERAELDGALDPESGEGSEESLLAVPKEFRFTGLVPDERGDQEIPFEAKLTSLGGGIDAFVLPTFRERSQDNRPTDLPVELANALGPAAGPSSKEALLRQMAGIEFGEGTSFRTPTLIPFEVVEETASLIRYRYRTREGVEIEREYSFRKESFEVELSVTVRNGSRDSQTHRLQISTALEVTEAMKKGGGFWANFIPPADHLEALCYNDGRVTRAPYPSLVGEATPRRLDKGVRWVAADRQYFVSAVVLRDREDATCALEAVGPIARATLEIPEVVLLPGQEKRHKFTAYLGVKKASLLTLADAELEGAVDYRILGMNLAPLCTALLFILGIFHGMTGSWGLAILGLTVLVKLVLFPLNQRSGRSMRALSQLRPAMDAIKEKFPEDRQRQSEEMMKLYREHGVNPAGGCLPILIQMPIWFALYRSLWASVDLYQQDFLWLSDLTTPDPYYILPILLVVVMFLQQKMTPTTMDAAQQKMMLYTMPLIFGAMMIALPSGLCFYILVNTLLTIVQQHLINKTAGPLPGPRSVQGAPA